jgi:hypothetical protein
LFLISLKNVLIKAINYSNILYSKVRLDMGEIIFSLAEKFNIAPFLIQIVLLLFCLVGYAFFAPRGIDEVAAVIFGIISIVVIIVSRLINGKVWFQKPSNQNWQDDE